MYSEKTIAKLNDVAYKYRDIFAQAINDVLRQSSNTGAGAASVTVDVVDGDASKSPQIIINMDDHVLFLDKRKLQWTALPNMRKLMVWAATKKSDESEAKRLAWAVAWDKKKNDTWKPKPWRKKSLSKVLKELNQMLLQAFDAAINEDMQDAINRAR